MLSFCSLWLSCTSSLAVMSDVPGHLVLVKTEKGFKAKLDSTITFLRTCSDA